MHNEFTAIMEKDENWYIAYCAEIPGAKEGSDDSPTARQEPRPPVGFSVWGNLHKKQEMTG
uniref:Uncharacterized protein n=1 Tax=Candidatus Kentrum sp. FM TaxID=2126340 RepID=A0A450TCH8_9GAMM|nr:MAG: hypothetical protein BECKFM1743C_GA0114222_103552 [Candidatus Kentron sp. FM]VFJ64555.1 MAG: hypothetical protein BECKFM1743A_GA0114220_103595 [Candidatus Kentron sp. FM]VFK15143.1 MAG: hypothetical protein BECKFM1743B_GA0114221_103572 [Candidatus Kentron sp. FM]